MLLAALDRILSTLALESIPVMLLKGSALLETVYPDISLRPMADLDLLVPQQSIRRAHAMVANLGYQVSGATLTRDDDDRLAHHHHHYPLVSPTGAISIELHQHVTEAGPEFDIAHYWAHSKPGAGEAPHLLPDPEDLFLHVAVHFTADRIERRAYALGQLADLAWIAGRWSLNWQALGDRALSYGQGHRLFLALVAMDELLGGIVPRSLIDSLRPHAYREAMGREFVTQRVLRSRPAISLEQIARGGLNRIFPGVPALEGYIRLDDQTIPPLVKLRLRRTVGLSRRLARGMSGPRVLVGDVRLSRWLLSLQARADSLSRGSLSPQAPENKRRTLRQWVDRGASRLRVGR